MKGQNVHESNGRIRKKKMYKTHTHTHICKKTTLLFIGGSQNTISKNNIGILELKNNVI